MVTNSNVSKRDKEEDHKKDESQQSSNEESQEYQYLDDDPTSDCELPNELSEEINGLNANELSIRNTLLEILHQYQSKDVESDKILISLNFINGIIDITNVNVKKIVQSKLSELNEGQQWFDQVLNKKTWTPTSDNNLNSTNQQHRHHQLSLESSSFYNNNNSTNNYHNNNNYNKNNDNRLLNLMTTSQSVQGTSANNALYEEIRAQERQLLEWITTQI
ncbi:20727_t:CDS:2 [Entrophospora sp. SA101]|nr:20727_t:CDS:2 [Entrophospora sp. SA101]